MQTAAEYRAWSVVLPSILSQELIDCFSVCRKSPPTTTLLPFESLMHTSIVYDSVWGEIHAWLCKWVGPSAHRSIIFVESRLWNAEGRGKGTKGRHSGRLMLSSIVRCWSVLTVTLVLQRTLVAAEQWELVQFRREKSYLYFWPDRVGGLKLWIKCLMSIFNLEKLSN